MIILALDSSSQAASAALWRDGILLGESFLNTRLTHSQTLLPLVQHLLQMAEVGPDQPDLFAVSVGPGSFTGLRIGISAVKGMAFAAGRPCAAVSTLEALAANLVAFQGLICPVMDARCQQVYTALFQSQNGVLTRLCPDSALPLDQLEADLRQRHQEVLLVGDGAALCAGRLADVPWARLAPPALLHQRASSVAAVAAAQDQATWLTADDLAPAYLRLPQAEREYLMKKQVGGSQI